ncbi:MAG TPA: ATP-dependent RNA helicase HrpA [Candidatus Competibacter denitrificans]|uniref:ATP-dependent RNA helicase HrpA n=1 Tax=Candidatus Competibacter denitrificans TaxID=1400862 RepID=UPI001F5BB401|nr:ATP-dependent RNA helicase HrpA [Candidatus Competibacter denitrificans]HRC68387.1 ATP-dependent RNA helicase HrpA [Candidatus Competibacter denitrificans]
MEPLFLALKMRLMDCASRDRSGFTGRLRGLHQRARDGKPVDRGLEQLRADIEASIVRLQERRAALPAPEFDDSLPISAHRGAIAAAIHEHPVVVICGETGSGKTTQLPKICLSLGLGVAGLIGHTQPRRIAARSVAARIAAELKTTVGGQVGYKVRFSDRTGPQAFIKLMTDGILLAETQGDRLLEQYEVIILDEAHERSLNIDFLLGYLKRLLPRRPDLKLIITSATIDPTRFSRHFNDAPIIEVSGRSYPVEIRYRPLIAVDEDERDRDLQQAILDAVDEVWQAGPGDILIFLSGEREIRETAESLRKHHPPNTEILPLYARLSAAEQNRVFQPHGRPRIVLATNVAETSLTVPGIRYVIDPGTARISRYSPRGKIQRLPIEKISQASANQRAGRCGRVMAGVCIRLYAEDDYQARPPFTDPEILRTHLAAVILQMSALNLGRPEDFPFVEPPDSRQISDGFRLLFELQAVDEQRRITELGRQLARLPLDPRLGRMLLAARQEGCLHEVLVIVAALAVQDPRERPLERQQAADEKHRRFRDEHSDFLALLKLWEYYHDQARQLSKNQLRNLCQAEFLSFVRLREWHDLHHELLGLTTEMGMRLNEEAAPYPNLHRGLLTGLLGHLGLKQEENAYLGARGRNFYLFPGSGLFKKRPRWVAAAELVETSRLYARTVARIEPEWVEGLAEHLLKRSYAEPHWEKRSAQVAALERVTLYGLPLIANRRVNYGPLDPALAREIFIRHALVAGDFHCKAPFFQHNRELLAELEELETRARRDLTADEESLYRFYDERIPEGIYSGPAFETWRKQAEREKPRLLFLDRATLLAAAGPVSDAERFPDHLDLDGLQLPLTYRFSPGADDDGVTLTVPLAAVNQVDAKRLDWLVLGLRAERMAALLKSLPKAVRRNFVPVPNYVQALLEVIEPGARSLTEAMTERLEKMTGVRIPEDAWNPAAVPVHLRMRVQVVDVDGQVLAVGRDWATIQAELRGEARHRFAALPTPEFERERLRDWDFGELAEDVSFMRNGIQLRGYPALVAEADGTLSLRLLDSLVRAEAATRVGLRRLLSWRLGAAYKQLARDLPKLQQMTLHYLGLGVQEALREDLLAAILDRAFLNDQPLPRERAAFETLLERGKTRLAAVRVEICESAAAILAAYQEVRRLLNNDSLGGEAIEDIRNQLASLIYPGFINQTPPEWLPHLPRYLRAIHLRLQKLRQAPDKDRQRSSDIIRLSALWQRQAERNALGERYDLELIRFRWLLEELRVSQFAQELKTVMPVSVKRLEEHWARVRQN